MKKTDITNFITFTDRALITSMISATFSFFSSLLVIIFISRSESKLRGTYHRIMCFMSFWDLISSLAIFATTLPMPADVYTVYPFEGPAYGNASSCAVQAFLIVLGSAFTISSNCALNFYYVCTIRFGMGEDYYNKFFIPLALLLPIALIAPLMVSLFSLGLFNPVPSFPYCVVGPYPYNCNAEDEVECIRGGGTERLDKIFQQLSVFIPCIALIAISISLILVISAVLKTELTTRNAIQEFQSNALDGGANGDSDVNSNDDANSDTTDDSTSPHKQFVETRTVLRQALMYIAAFFLTWGWNGIFFFISTGGSQMIYAPALDQLRLTFQPLQGFFNALIFFYSKMLVLRKSRRQLSFSQAVKIVMYFPRMVPDMLISSLEMVGNENENNESVHPHDDRQMRTPGRSVIFRASPQREVSDLNSFDDSKETTNNQLIRNNLILENDEEKVINNDGTNDASKEYLVDPARVSST